jgi:segregation and condensation protein A
MYEVKTLAYSGPLEKLLELIEAKKMDITQISLAEVTADFLLYVDSIKEEAQKTENDADEETKVQALRMLADFLVVASQLILIKSKALLPELSLSEEEENEIHDLEARLKIYSQLKPMFAAVKNEWSQSSQIYSRAMLLSQPVVFYPPKKLTLKSMGESLDRLLNSLGSFFLDKETIKRQLFTLEDKISEVTKKIAQGISKFSEIIGRKTKNEVIVIFLALLQLLRENTFAVSQEKLFDEIKIEKKN